MVGRWDAEEYNFPNILVYKIEQKWVVISAAFFIWELRANKTAPAGIIVIIMPNRWINRGPDIFGVVCLAQAKMELARIEANISGLSPGKHGWSINEFSDLTRGAASTGKLYNPTIEGSAKEPLGHLGTLDVDDKGVAFFSGVKEKLRVADLIGRSIVVYGTEDKPDSGITAAVIARSAEVG